MPLPVESDGRPVVAWLAGGDWRGAGAVYALLGLAAAALYVPWLGGSLHGDDWMVLARNLDPAWREIPGWFVAVRHDWYRPAFELLAAGGWQVFGPAATGYRAVSLALYAGVAAMVGLLAERLVDDRRVGLTALAVFAFQGHHAEAVLWFAAASDLLLALFGLGSLAAYIRYREHNSRPWLATALFAWLLSLASKETAISLPAIWLIWELIFGGRRGSDQGRRRWLPAASAAAASAAFALWRSTSGGIPYAVPLTAPALLRNVGHYASLLLAVPIDFDHTFGVSLSEPSHVRALAAASTAVLGLLITGCVWLRDGLWRRHWRLVLFAVLFSLLALSPVLPIVAERAAFLGSVGVAWAFAGGLVAAWRSAAIPSGSIRRQAALRWALGAGVALMLLGQSTVLAYRAAAQRRAAAVSQSVLDQLAFEIESLPPGVAVRVLNLPDHEAYAYVFRNAWPHVATVLGWPDVDGYLRGQEPSPKAMPSGAVVLWYDSGRLSRR